MVHAKTRRREEGSFPLSGLGAFAAWREIAVHAVERADHSRRYRWGIAEPDAGDEPPPCISVRSRVGSRTRTSRSIVRVGRRSLSFPFDAAERRALQAVRQCLQA